MQTMTRREMSYRRAKRGGERRKTPQIKVKPLDGYEESLSGSRSKADSELVRLCGRDKQRTKDFTVNLVRAEADGVHRKVKRQA